GGEGARADLAREEGAGQGVVVFRGDRVELVVVAAGAGQGEPQELPAHDVDLAVNDLGDGQVAAHQLPHGQREHAGRGDAVERGPADVDQRLVTRAGGQEVAGQLHH